MSFQRRLRAADRPVTFNSVTRRPCCRWCGKDVPPPKLTFCGPACVHEYLLRSDPAYLRAEVFKRDKGVCCRCGFDTVKFQRALWGVTPAEREARKLAQGFPAHRDSFWDADHILPVCEGGGLCGLDGIATLCISCHLEKSRAA